MGRFLSISCLVCPAALACSLPSCSFLEDSPVPQSPHNLACYTSISVCRAGGSSYQSSLVESLDIFIYDASDSSLDSYRHLDFPEGDFDGTVEAASTGGDRIVSVAANLHSDSFAYSDILDYGSLERLQASLYEESAGHPLMSGGCRVNAGVQRSASVELRPVCASVRIHSLSVDFSQRPYSSSSLTDLRAYLINVNASCSFINPEAVPATDILNCGRLDETAVKTMACPSLVLGDGAVEGTKLRCFPCSEGEDNAPATLLVVEGKLGERLYYYPIAVGNGTVKAGTEYVYDIRITRSGSDNPDEVLSDGMQDINLSVKDWYESDWENISY